MSSWSVPDPGAPPVAPPATRIRPSWVWYLVAGLVALAAVAGAIVLAALGVVRFFDRIDDLQRVVVPGESTVEIDDPGGYTIYFEYRGAAGGEDFLDGEDPPQGLQVEVTGPDGQPVPIEPYSGRFVYADGDNEGSAQWTFDAPQAGAYVVRGTYAGEPSAQPQVVLAVGGSLAGGLVGYVVGAVAVAGIGLLIALVVLIVTVIRRSRSKREARQAAQAWSASAGSPWGAAPPPAGPGPAPPPPPPPST